MEMERNGGDILAKLTKPWYVIILILIVIKTSLLLSFMNLRLVVTNVFVSTFVLQPCTHAPTVCSSSPTKYSFQYFANA